MTWNFLCLKVRVIGLCAVLFLGGTAVAQDSRPPSEYRIKAAFLFNFAKFVEWPPENFHDSTAPFVIGVLGENPFGSDLEQTVRGKRVNERPFVVKFFSTPSEATNCHILFICASEKKRLPEILQALRGRTVLTVGENLDHFMETGGMINFLVVENKIRFQINDAAAKTARLQINSKLLGLAMASH